MSNVYRSTADRPAGLVYEQQQLVTPYSSLAASVAGQLPAINTATTTAYPNRWSGMGMNIGGDFSFNTTYPTTEVTADLAFLWSAGFRALRIALPAFNDPVGTSNMQQLAVAAKAVGFYVSYGVTYGGTAGTLTNTILTGTMQTAVLAQAVWAQANGIDEFQVANELENAQDGTTLVDAGVRSWVRTVSQTVKTNGYTGKVSYSVGQGAGSTQKSGGWAATSGTGLGGLDYLAINIYSDDQLDSTGNFDVYTQALITAYGLSKIYISEFNIYYAWTAATGMTLSPKEIVDQVSDRIIKAQGLGVARAMFFCWRFAADAFACKTAAGPLAPFWWVVSGQLPALAPSPPTVSPSYSPQGPTTSTSGAPGTANFLYCGTIQIPSPTALKGISIYNGSTLAGNVLIGLFNAAGAQVAVSNSTAQSGSFTVQPIPFNAAAGYITVGAGDYTVAIMLTSTTADMALICTTGRGGGYAQGSFVMPATITPPAIFGAYIPYMSTY